jgi:hypothetical protein
LHAVALCAAQEGVASLTIDGSAFSGETPFYAFTERRAGLETTSWFDPLRGLTAPEPKLSALLSRFEGRVVDFEDFVLEQGTFAEGYDRAGTIRARRDGNLLSPPRLDPFVPWTPAPPGPFERVCLALAALIPIALTQLVFRLSGRPATLEQALPMVSLAVMVSFPLMLFEFPTPGGRVIPWPIRVLWFAGSPFAVMWLDITLRGRS